MALQKPPIAEHVAVIFGVTGLVGRELARQLTAKPGFWKKVYGISRNPDPIGALAARPNFHFIQCDLQNPHEAQQKLNLSDVTHMFWITWASQSQYDTPACCVENKAMLSNALNAVVPKAPLKHVSLQTGLKHYIPLKGPFDVADSDATIYDEDCPRVGSRDGNFYYVLEDLLEERLREKKIPWSVHRPGLLMGSSCRSFYNFVGCLGVYGAICRRLKAPFVFGGTRRCWEEFVLDGSDARLVAEQHVWAATCGGEGQAFNAVNGPGFTWRELWPGLAESFGVEDGGFCGEFRYVEAMAGMGGVWEEMVEEEGLLETRMEDLANWEFLDMVFCCPVKLLGTRHKADRLGFNLRYDTADSLSFWIDAMRRDKLIPY